MICVDESTIKWRVFKLWHLIKGCPQVTNIAGKPELVCIEVKDSSCVMSGIFLRLEIMEVKVAMSTKKYCDSTTLAGSAQILRLTEPWHNMGYAVVADGAFASVPTCVLLHKYGIYFTGLIKIAHKFYPLKFLQQQPMTFRGETFNLKAVCDGVKLLATVWNDPNKPGKPRKYLVSKCGSTARGKDCEQPRKKVNTLTGGMDDVTLVVPRSKVVEHYFTHAGAIDRANHVRQDGFQMERNVEVKDWERCAWISLLGFVAADAYAAWKLMGHQEDETTFMKKLCYELINNEKGVNCDDLVLEGGGRKRGKGKRKIESDDVESSDTVYPHLVRSLRELEGGEVREDCRLKCMFCGNKCTVYCRICSEPKNKKLVVFCCPSTGRDCMEKHLYE